jgi:hypothetical protein
VDQKVAGSNPVIHPTGLTWSRLPEDPRLSLGWRKAHDLCSLAYCIPAISVEPRRPGADMKGGRSMPPMEIRQAFQDALASLVDREQPHYREFRRREVDIPAEVHVFLPDGTWFDRGTARIANISASGALLVNLDLAGRRIPIESCILQLIMRGGPFDGVAVRCRPVRPVPERGGLGVRLDDILVSIEEKDDRAGERQSA